MSLKVVFVQLPHLQGEISLTNCTFSGLLILEPRRPPPLLLPLPSEAEAAENRLSSSDISISGALQKLPPCGMKKVTKKTREKI